MKEIVIPKYCPICKSELVRCGDSTKSCINNCYKAFYIKDPLIQDVLYIEVYIFGESFVIFRAKSEDRKEKEKKLNSIIKYWKKNDRYLMKILEGR